MKTYRLKLPAPHPAQTEVLAGARRFNSLCCGRRWGKTILGIDRLVSVALTGKPTAWFAPIYKDLSEVWRTIVRILEPITVKISASEHWLEIVGGGRVECWSLDTPGAGRGRAYAEIVIDEDAKVPNLEEQWEQTVRPMLADYEGGAWIISTPKGRANYFSKLFNRGLDPLQPDWACWQMPTAMNRYISAREIESMREEMTDLAFAQEVLAQFVTWAGAVFRRISDAVRPITHEPAAMIGCDWGRTGDYTVFTAVSARGQVTAADRFRGIEYALQRARLAAFWQQCGSRAHIIAETNAMGAPVVEQLQRDGLPVFGFNTTNATKSAIIQALALAFERGTITIPNDPVLIGELQAFEGKPTASGLTRYAAPDGLHDDCVMSLAMAWAGLLMPQEQRLFIDPSTGGRSTQYPQFEISPI